MAQSFMKKIVTKRKVTKTVEVQASLRSKNVLELNGYISVWFTAQCNVWNDIYLLRFCIVNMNIIALCISSIVAMYITEY